MPMPLLPSETEPWTIPWPWGQMPWLGCIRQPQGVILWDSCCLRHYYWVLCVFFWFFLFFVYFVFYLGIMWVHCYGLPDWSSHSRNERVVLYNRMTCGDIGVPDHVGHWLTGWGVCRAEGMQSCALLAFLPPTCCCLLHHAWVLASGA